MYACLCVSYLHFEGTIKATRYRWSSCDSTRYREATTFRYDNREGSERCEREEKERGNEGDGWKERREKFLLRRADVVVRKWALGTKSHSGFSL